MEPADDHSDDRTRSTIVCGVDGLSELPKPATKRTAPDDAGPASGTRHIRPSLWPEGVPRPRAARSETASWRRLGPAPNKRPAPAACRKGTATRSRTSGGERLHTDPSK